jgi:hypothetical protein
MASHPYYDDGLLDEYENGGADIVALGDSWFHYPGSNLLEALNRALSRSFVIAAYGENGASAVDYMKPRHLPFWTGRVQLNATRMRAFLISGGGNDFAGLRDFSRIIHLDCSAATSVAECWRDGEPDGLLGRVANAYERIIARVRADGFNGPVVVHNYDYAVPTGKGFFLFGKWLKAPMDLAQVPSALRRPLVRELIDRLEITLRGFDDPSAQVHCVDSSGALAEDEWANELLPTSEGFDRIVRERWIPVVAPLLGIAVPAAVMTKTKPARKKAKKTAKKIPRRKAARRVKKHP